MKTVWNFSKYTRKIAPWKFILTPPQKLAPCPDPNQNPNPNPGRDFLVAIYRGGNFPFTFSKAAYFCREKKLFFQFDAFKTLLKWRNFKHKNSYLTLWKLNSCRNQENLPKHIIGKHLSCVSILVFGLFQLLLKSLDIFGRKN